MRSIILPDHDDFTSYLLLCIPEINFHPWCVPSVLLNINMHIKARGDFKTGLASSRDVTTNGCFEFTAKESKILC